MDNNTLKEAFENIDRSAMLYEEGQRLYRRGRAYKKAGDVCAFIYKCTNIKPFGVASARDYIRAAILCDLATDARSKGFEAINNAAEKLKTHSDQKKES